MIRKALLGLVLSTASAVTAAAELPPLSCADAGAMTRVFMMRERITERVATECIASYEDAACQAMRDSLAGSPYQMQLSDTRRAGWFMLWLLRACAADPAFR